MRYEFHPEALEEYNEAAFYYAQRERGLELRFIYSVENASDRILQEPLRYRPFDEDVRRCLARTFPYAILYGLARTGRPNQDASAPQPLERSIHVLDRGPVFGQVNRSLAQQLPAGFLPLPGRPDAGLRSEEPQFRVTRRKRREGYL